MQDLSYKYENGIVYKKEPVFQNKKRKSTEPRCAYYAEDEMDEDEEQRLKNIKLYRAGKYKYSLFNPQNV